MGIDVGPVDLPFPPCQRRRSPINPVWVIEYEFCHELFHSVCGMLHIDTCGLQHSPTAGHAYLCIEFRCWFLFQDRSGQCTHPEIITSYRDFWPSRTRVLTSDPSAAQATRRRPEPKAVNAVTARGRLHREARVVAEAAGLRYSSDADKQIQTGMSTSQ